MTTDLVVTITDEILEELEREVGNELKAGGYSSMSFKSCHAILDLISERAELKRDAERYRWLRSQPVKVPTIGPDLAYWEEHAGEALRFDQADSAIDKAMQERQE